jgi:hypothetical protein
MIRKKSVDSMYRAFSNAVAEVARLSVQVDDPARNVLGITVDKLERAKLRVEHTLREIMEQPR